MKKFKRTGAMLATLVLTLVVACNSSSDNAIGGISLLGFSGWVTSDEIYILDSGNRTIRVVDRNTGNIDAFAGTGSSGFSPDGTANTSTNLGNYSMSLIAASDGRVIYSNLQSNCVQAFSGGTVTTIAGICGSPGNDGDGGNAVDAHITTPMGICVDSSQNLYITDVYASVIRKVDYTTGIISTFAGNGSSGYDNTKDGGSALLAPMSPSHCVVDSEGNLYFTNTNSNVVQKVTSAGIISTIAGNGSSGSSGDDGPAVDALLSDPTGLALDGVVANTLYVSDSGNQVVRKIDLKTGIISVYAGVSTVSGTSGDGGAATSANLSSPEGISVKDGELYIALAYGSDHKIRKVDANGIITTVVGTGVGGNSGDGGAATAAEIQYPYSFYDWWD